MCAILNCLLWSVDLKLVWVHIKGSLGPTLSLFEMLLCIWFWQVTIMIIWWICFCSYFWILIPKWKKMRSKEFLWVLLKETWKDVAGLKRRLAGQRSDSLPHALSPGRVNCVVPSELKTFSPSSTPECVRSCQAWRAGCAWRATSPRCSREALPRLTITPITMATAVRHRWVVLQESMTAALLSFKNVFLCQ